MARKVGESDAFEARKVFVILGRAFDPLRRSTPLMFACVSPRLRHGGREAQHSQNSRNDRICELRYQGPLGFPGRSTAYAMGMARTECSYPLTSRRSLDMRSRVQPEFWLQQALSVSSRDVLPREAAYVEIPRHAALSYGYPDQTYSSSFNYNFTPPTTVRQSVFSVCLNIKVCRQRIPLPGERGTGWESVQNGG